MGRRICSYVSCSHDGITIFQLIGKLPGESTWAVEDWGAESGVTVLAPSIQGNHWVANGNGAWRLRPRNRAKAPRSMRGVFFTVDDVKTVGGRIFITRTQKRTVMRFDRTHVKDLTVKPAASPGVSAPTIQQFRDALGIVNDFKRSMGNDLVLSVRSDGTVSATMEI